MPTFPVKVKDEEKRPPSIMVAAVYDRSEGNLKNKRGGVDPTKILKYRVEPIKDGMIIERGGRLYRVDAKGTQRRIK